MKAHRVAIAILLLSATAFACGHERWTVKVLTDSDRANVNRTSRTSTIHALRALNGPANSVRTSHQNTRISPVELRTYRVHALLIGFKHEADDDDLHLVIANPANQAETM